jgi:hypothetical protein
MERVHENSGEQVNASELAEFVYCQRAWALANQGGPVSEAVEQQRGVGNRFHNERAASEPGTSPAYVRWAVVLLIAGLLLLLINALVTR